MESNRHSVKTVIKQTKKRHRHHHRRTKKISQKIELKKQHFQCVINLNTTICGDEASRSKLNKKICTKCVSYGKKPESNRISSIIREPISLKPQCYTRIAPYCFREKCRGLKPCRCQKIRERKHHVKDTMAKHHQNNRRKHRQDIGDSRLASRLPDRQRKLKNASLKLSPISSSPLKDNDDLNHLYEDISNDSLDKVLEKPMSYKNIKYVENKVESKLDTLIKRTKERERKQVAQLRTQPKYSISSVSNMSSGECPMDLGSCDTLSLHSRSTLILEKSQSDFVYLSPESQEYSRSPQSEFTFNFLRKYEHGPSENYFNTNTKKYEHDRTYSPVSPPQNDFIMNVPKKYEHAQTFSAGFPSKNDFNMNVPSEYEHDRTYSPVSPQQNDFIMNIPKKYEHAHTFLPGISSKNDFNMNIPTEYEHDRTYSPVSPQQNDFIMNIPKKYEHAQTFSAGFPSKNDFNMNVPSEYEHDRTYSPVSPQQNDFIMNISKKYEHAQTFSARFPSKNNLIMHNIKVEPIDIGMYSPTFDYSNEEIKKEVKIKSESFVDVMEMLDFDIKKEV